MATLRAGRTAVGLLALWAASGSARATDSSTDMSDLWWVPSESGWGVQIVQQSETLFATLFVYGPDGQPTWYSATLAPKTSDTVSGSLYRTTGSWLGAPSFDPGGVTRSVVGTMSITWTRIASATLSYTVGGATVVKTIERQTLVPEDIRGAYVGVASFRSTGLPPCTPDDQADAIPTTWTVGGSVKSVTFVAKSAVDTCTYTGPYVQSGRFGRVSGSYACASGASGSFAFYEMGRDFYALRARTLVSLPSGCLVNGYLVGLEQPPPMQ